MMHTKRRWCIGAVASPEQLARMLTEHTWTLCSAFCVAGKEEYLFLNDATHEDGAAELAVLLRIRPDRFVPIESISFSWPGGDRALALIQEILAGKYDESEHAGPVQPKIDTPEKHGHCHL